MKNDDLDINKAPSIFWQKFLDRFSEIETLPVKDWQSVHLLAYISKRYFDHYKVKFSFRFNSSSPSKSYEIVQLRKIAQMISSDPSILKDYIDWFFDYKIILKKKRITTLAFFTDISNCNEYKMKFLIPGKDQSIERTSLLPSNILEIASNFNIDCKTYGDLAFIQKSALDNKQEQGFINDLIKSGFDITILNNVK